MKLQDYNFRASTTKIGEELVKWKYSKLWEHRVIDGGGRSLVVWLQDGFQRSLLAGTPLCCPSHLVPGMCCLEYGITNFCLSAVSFSHSVSHHLPEENQLPFHKQPYGEAQMVKRWDFLANNYVTELESESSSSAKPSDDYSLADILVVTTWDALNQKHSVKLFPDHTIWNGVRY